MIHFLIALQFLTIFPVNIKKEIKKEDFGKSLIYFPLIGLIVGLVLAFSLFIFNFFPSQVKGALILLLSIIITGGIHLDGFADTCDGFYAGRSKEKILQIMKDSRIGVMGVIGVVCLLLLKFTLIMNIPQNILWKSLIMMAVFARWSQVLTCYISDYVRKEGKAKFYIEYACRKDVFVGGLSTFILFLLLVGLKGSVIFILTFFTTLLFVQYVKKKIGGVTGDTIGATNEIAEVVVLFFTLILLSF